ncbi:MAG: hypothetical protein FWB90_06200 [Fibromonadales bacterium]|nr:hypothetical protein [Fibromonadales bacterium]
MKIYVRFLFFVSIMLVSTVSANSLSESCEEEILDLLEDYDLDMKELIKDLVPVAVKVKVQAKAPLQFLLGPGPDDKMTDIGVSVGCLKELPESAGAITSMFKSLGLEAANGATASNTKSKSQDCKEMRLSKAKKLKSKMLYIC